MILTKRHPGYAFVSMPNGQTARIPIEHGPQFDKDEANEFEQAARARGHVNILALLDDLRRQGLSPQQATGVVCEYLNLLEREGGG